MYYLSNLVRCLINIISIVSYLSLLTMQNPITDLVNWPYINRLELGLTTMYGIWKYIQVFIGPSLKSQFFLYFFIIYRGGWAKHLFGILELCLSCKTVRFEVHKSIERPLGSTTRFGNLHKACYATGTGVKSGKIFRL